jgi:hypothetical protein
MKRNVAVAVVSFLAVLSLTMGQAYARGPTDIKGNPIHTKARIGLGVRAGFSVFPQTAIDGADSKVGFAAGGSAFYGITDWLHVGVAADWAMHRHELESTDIDLGHDSIITILPFAELRGPFSSYLYFGVGYNLNDLNDIEDVLGNTIDMENTLAIQGGAGWDAFVSQYFAINVEIGYNYNKGDAELVQGPTRVPLGDVDLSTIVFTVGLRYFFPPLF